jgi:hypothetical protein
LDADGVAKAVGVVFSVLTIKRKTGNAGSLSVMLDSVRLFGAGFR